LRLACKKLSLFFISMSHLPLGYSDFNNEENKRNNQKVQGRGSTRRRRIRSSKAQSFLNSMDSDDRDQVGEGRESEGLENFEPLEPAKLTRDRSDESETKNTGGTSKLNPSPNGAQESGGDDEPVSYEGFKQLPNDALQQQYYNQFVQKYGGTKQYVPYYPQLSQAGRNGESNELMKKLNYMIHLLEEQKDEQTQNVTEELVLYVFLGVFVIFVVDSFARAAKYTR